MKHLFNLLLFSGVMTVLTPSGLFGQTPVAELGKGGRVSVCAHRGAHLKAPENTLLSFQHAIDMGCDLVEIDVRTTKDGHLVLMHDSTVDRTTEGTGRVDELTLKQIRNLSFGSDYPNEKVPTYEEALAYCKGKINVYVDHKAADHTRVIEGIRKYDLSKNVVIYSTTKELLQFKKIAPEIWITTPHPDTVEGIKQMIEKLKPETLDGNIVNWNHEQAEATHAAGVKIWIDYPHAWDNAEGVRKGLEIGVDLIQTDHPERIMDLLDKAGRRPRS